ncbi:phosphoenolpyruvate synthase [Nanoarchaeota archaeon]
MIILEHIKWFKDIGKEDIPSVGGKGANLGEMYNIGLPVPDGFFVTAQTYKEFIEKTKIKDKITEILSGLDVENTEELQKRANQVQKLIVETPIPQDIREDIIEAYEVMGTHHDVEAEANLPFVAIRSSATAEDLPTASFAGQQATFLNIKGMSEIVSSVRLCWASLFTARAVYYRVKNDFEHMKVFISVVVQRMVDSDKSGIMFSVNPSTNNLNEIVVEAGWGLGEAVVSGSINPDLYIVDKDSMEIKKKELKKQVWGLFRDPDTGKNVKKNISEEVEAKQVISDEQIVSLAELAKKIEEHYGSPQDIEFAVEKNKIYIVQSRAVTTIKKEEKVEDVEEHGEVLVKGETASSGVASGPVKLIKEMEDLKKIEKGDVMVTKMTTPDMVPIMQKAAAIVTDEGGMTCHAAIVSRELGIPCIVGTENGTQILKEGEIITVNATHGTVLRGAVKIEVPKEEVKETSVCEPVTATQVKVIMDIPDVAEKAASTGADGVGLVRLEIMIATGGVHPAEYIRQDRDEDYVNLLADGIRKIANAFKGKPVWVRCSDLRTDEYRNLQGADQEPNETDPMLGWHAIRRLLDEPRILKAEFKAIKKLKDEGVDNIGVMLPFVIRAREVSKAKEIMKEVGLEGVEFGVMIETPASCWVIEEIIKEGIDFVSFGTNDLTQLTLGIDRNNQRIAHLFDEMHPSVLGEIEKVVEVCKRNNVKTSICGQAGSRPEMAEFLVKIGIDSISANPDAVHQIREVVAREEKKLLLEADREELGQN